MADSRCEELLRISGTAFEKFRPWYQLNQDIAENFYPMRADFTTSLNLQNFAGDSMDSSPFQARETLGNSIDAMLRQGQWFRMGTGDADLDKRPANLVALTRGTTALTSIVYHRDSGVTGALKELDMDWVAFGANVMSVEASSALQNLVYKPWHLRDNAWIVNKDGVIDWNNRNLRMSARDIKKKFDQGEWTGTMAPAIRDAAQRDPLKEFLIRHILMPSDEIYGSSQKDMKRLGGKPYVSIYIDVENRTYLNDRGSAVFNYVIGRNRTLSGLPFGFSPMALNSIADARMLQELSLVILEQGQKAVDPPTIGAGHVFTRDINLFAGGHTEVDLPDEASLKDVFATVETGQVGVGLEIKQDTRNLIAEAWLLNKLMLPTLRDMREVEVMVRTDEFRRAALPFFQPIESNYHGEFLGVSYDMAVHLRMMRPDMFTAELRGKGVNFTFTSPLNEAEGTEIVRQYYEAVNIVAAGAKVDQTIANLFDIRKATEDAITRGTRSDWLVPEEQRKEADKQADVVSGLTQAAQIGREAAGVTADMANASLAAQQAGLAPA